MKHLYYTAERLATKPGDTWVYVTYIIYSLPCTRGKVNKVEANNSHLLTCNAFHPEHTAACWETGAGALGELTTVKKHLGHEREREREPDDLLLETRTELETCYPSVTPGADAVKWICGDEAAGHGTMLRDHQERFKYAALPLITGVCSGLKAPGGLCSSRCAILGDAFTQNSAVEIPPLLFRESYHRNAMCSSLAGRE